MRAAIRLPKLANIFEKLSLLVIIVSAACPKVLPTILISSSVSAYIGLDSCWLMAIKELKSGTCAKSYGVSVVPFNAFSNSVIFIAQPIFVSDGTSLELTAALILSIHA